MQTLPPQVVSASNEAASNVPRVQVAQVEREESGGESVKVKVSYSCVATDKEVILEIPDEWATDDFINAAAKTEATRETEFTYCWEKIEDESIK